MKTAKELWEKFWMCVQKEDQNPENTHICRQQFNEEVTQQRQICSKSQSLAITDKINRKDNSLKTFEKLALFNFLA